MKLKIIGDYKYYASLWASSYFSVFAFFMFPSFLKLIGFWRYPIPNNMPEEVFYEFFLEFSLVQAPLWAIVITATVFVARNGYAFGYFVGCKCKEYILQQRNKKSSQSA